MGIMPPLTTALLSSWYHFFNLKSSGVKHKSNPIGILDSTDRDKPRSTYLFMYYKVRRFLEYNQDRGINKHICIYTQPPPLPPFSTINNSIVIHNKISHRRAELTGIQLHQATTNASTRTLEKRE
jgi:hypothetical protein